jgi:2',3'-cyclic-nucleotide 2'-phosphodiesterase (5'-nucleotidase family)
MKFNNILFTVAFTLSVFSCSPKTWTIVQTTSTKIEIDSTTDQLADSNYVSYLRPIKQKIDAQMNVVIGQAAVTMKGHGPESLLSNLSADIYREAALKYTGDSVDMAVVNLGGLRTVIPAGNITVGKVFELMPFENELVILWLKGDKVIDLIRFFAKVGGEGVSGLRMHIAKGKAVEVTVGGKPVDPDKTYSIATNDYLAGGNDNMVQLAQYTKRVNTGLKIRSVLIDYIKNETKNGNKIQAKLDGRIAFRKE